jgi:hypothetical protein
MQFYDNRILLVKSSEVIDLYQIEEEHDKNQTFGRFGDSTMSRTCNNHIKWNKYYTLNHTGFVQLTPNCDTF